MQGAALGAAFQLLLVSAIDGTQRVTRFSSDLDRLKSTLASIKLTVDDIEEFNKILDRPLQETEAFTDRLLEGEKLVRKCSNVKGWDVLKRWYYSKKLSKLESIILRFFQIDVAALHFRESKRISVVVSSLEEKMNEVIKTLVANERSGIGRCKCNYSL